jgi:transposase
MPRKHYKPEEIVAKLRQVDVLVSQGMSTADAIRQIGVSEVACARRAAQRGGLLHPAGGSGRRRKLAASLQRRPASRITRIQTTSARGIRANIHGVAG